VRDAIHEVTITLNLLTLLAMVLSVGLVVDDAIVVVENVERHLREGRTPREAALIGGMAIGTVFTLFVVPSLYVLLAKDRGRELSDESLEPEAEVLGLAGSE